MTGGLLTKPPPAFAHEFGDAATVIKVAAVENFNKSKETIEELVDKTKACEKECGTEACVSAKALLTESAYGPKGQNWKKDGEPRINNATTWKQVNAKAERTITKSGEYGKNLAAAIKAGKGAMERAARFQKRWGSEADAPDITEVQELFWEAELTRCEAKLIIFANEIGDGRPTQSQVNAIDSQIAFLSQHAHLNVENVPKKLMTECHNILLRLVKPDDAH